MLQQLIESRPVATRRRGGSLASVMIHAAIIALAVIATRAEKGGARATKSVVPPLTYITVPASVPRGASQPARSRTSASTAPSPVLTVNTPWRMPVGFPTVDITIPVSGGDPFSGVVTSGIAPVPGASGGGGIGIPGGVVDAARVDRQPSVRGRAATPAYPELMRRSGVEGEVIAQFVVDTLGNLERGSVTIVSSPHAMFSDAVRAVLPAIHFAPGEVASRPVRTLVRMPFVFSLHP